MDFLILEHKTSLVLVELNHFQYCLLCEQLIIEGGTAFAIFIRCFVDKRGIEKELHKKLLVEFPRGVLATICVIVI